MGGLDTSIKMKEDCDAVSALASLDFMSAHDSQFDDHFITDKQNETGRFGKCPMPRAAKVIAAGGKRAASLADVDVEARTLLEDCWREHVSPYTSCASYVEMRTAVFDAWG